MRGKKSHKAWRIRFFCICESNATTLSQAKFNWKKGSVGSEGGKHQKNIMPGLQIVLPQTCLNGNKEGIIEVNGMLQQIKE